MTAVLVMAALAVLGFLIVFNGLVVKRNRCETAFSTIDVMLKKRYDLIPNLVATVKGYARHEAGLFEEVSRLRAQAASAALSTDRTVELNNQITGLLQRVLAVVEGYPELKANPNFLHLQRTLTELEEQISAARRAYNAAVLDLNNAVQMFPSSVVARVAGFGGRRFLEAGAPERQVPDVAERLRQTREARP